jgi:hypothetical protein
MDTLEEFGYLPAPDRDSHYTVDFCMGSPGTIPLLSAALDFSTDPDMRKRMLKIADDMGTQIWEEGILLKGKGLCHGIAGNGYLLHSLARMWVKWSKEGEHKNEMAEKRAETWKHRTNLFAHLMIDPFYD